MGQSELLSLRLRSLRALLYGCSDLGVGCSGSATLFLPMGKGKLLNKDSSTSHQYLRQSLNYLILELKEDFEITP